VYFVIIASNCHPKGMCTSSNCHLRVRNLIRPSSDLCVFSDLHRAWRFLFKFSLCAFN